MLDLYYVLFENGINERFSKLQDILAAAMRHSLILAGEKNDNFLQVLAFFEKQSVIESSTQWQLYRTTRNLATHDYELDYLKICAHFNLIYELIPALINDANRFIDYCHQELEIKKR